VALSIYVDGSGGDSSGYGYFVKETGELFYEKKPGTTNIYGRQSCDTRSMEEGDIDAGNSQFAGQEAMVILDNVFIPNELIFMNGEVEFAAMLIE
jgi:hypothetical protein